MVLTLNYIRDHGFDGLCVVNMSGGKDSITMLHMLLIGDFPVDLVLFVDTGVQRLETYLAVSKVEELCNKVGIRFVRVKSEESFLRASYPDVPILNYVGVCSDEAHRIQRSYNKKSDSYCCYPLFDMGVSEFECKKFVVEQGYYL